MTAALRAQNLDRGTALAERLEVADGLWAKFMGLMGRPGLEPETGLWLTGSNGIHMMFMRFAIDAVFLAKPEGTGDGGTGLVRSCRSTRVCAPGPGWSPSSAERTASSSCRSARSRGAGPRSATGSRLEPAKPE